MASSHKMLLLIFFSGILCIFATGNTTEPLTCRNATAAADVQFNLLRGIWFVQKYTGPAGGNLQTKCDVLNISVNNDAMSGLINYSFVSVAKGEVVVQIANLTVDGEMQGMFMYWMEFNGKPIIMHATVLHLDNDFLIHAACQDNVQGPETLLIASKKNMVSDAEMQSMMDLAAKQGGRLDNVQQVDHKTCSNSTQGSAPN